MKTYSMDLRERVVAACDRGDATREQIAAQFSVSVSWIRDLLGRRRDTGSDGPVPHGHWKVVTLTAAVRLGGVPQGVCLAFDGATNTAGFEAYVGKCLVPTLRPGDIVVMDNLSCHKSPEVARLIESAGAGVRYLPAYSPDLNPIERLFSKLKAWLRKAKARTVEALINAMGDALRGIQPSDIVGWFAHSGFDSHGATARSKKETALTAVARSDGGVAICPFARLIRPKVA